MQCNAPLDLESWLKEKIEVQDHRNGTEEANQPKPGIEGQHRAGSVDRQDQRATGRTKVQDQGFSHLRMA
jgi:hypothetical protein